MAFAALISVRNTMERFANFLETVQIPYMDMEILEEIIEKLDEESSSKTVKALERQIREALHGLEDAADSVRTNMTLISQSDQSIANERHAIYVEEIRRGISNISSFFLTTMKIQEEYSKEFEEDDSDDDDDDEEELLEDDDDDYDFDYDDVSSRSGFGGKRSKLVGVCDQLTKIKDELTAAYKSYELRVVSFVGVAGTGRSYVASNIFDRIDSVGGKDCLFKLRAWVSIGQKYEFKNILVEILSYIDNDDKIELVAREEDEKIFEYLYTRLKSGRFFIVLDDVWETGVWEYLKKLFPDENNGSRVFLTTHLEEVALFAKSVSMYPTRALKKEESWNLLSTVLSQKRMLCHPEFEKAGKKIAENCRGLQIEVAKVAILLFKCKKPEQWKKVAEDMETSVAIAKDAYDEISEVIELQV